MSSCAHTPRDEGVATERDFRVQVSRIGAALDRAAAHADEWGTLSISGPLIASDAQDFRFDLSMTAKELFEGNKKVEGASFSSVTQALSAAIAAKVKQPLEPPEAPKPAPSPGGAGSGGGSSGAGTTQPSTPSGGAGAGATGAPAQAKPPELIDAGTPPTPKGADAVGKFTEPQARMSGDTAISQRRLLRETASDVFEQGLHKTLSGARQNQLGEGYELAYVVFTVTCQPGWRSRSGFVGQVDARVEFFGPSGPLGDANSTNHPMVVAVYPAFEGQELDLRTSLREMYALAAQLSFLGEVAGANALLDYARRQERDTRTNTALSLVTSYASGGRNFGYEFRPVFRAQTDPAEKTPRAGYELDAVTFPAVAVVAMHRSDWEPLLRQEPEAYGAALREAVLRTDASRGVLTLPQTPSPDADDEQIASTLEAMESIERNFVATLGDPKERQDFEAVLAHELRKNLRLGISISHTWRPLGQDARDASGRAFNRPQQQALMLESSRAAALMGLRDAWRMLEQINAADAADEQLLDQLIERWWALDGRLSVADPVIPWPDAFVQGPAPTPVLSVSAVSPRNALMGRDNVFYVIGSGFSHEKVGVALVVETKQIPIPDANVTVSADNILKVSVPASMTEAKGPGLTFEITRGSQRVFTPPFAIQ